MANRPGESRFAIKISRCSGVGGPGPQLQPVLFFLQKLNRHYSILFEPAIKLAAIDSQRCGSLDLIATKLLQHRKNVALLDLSQGHAVGHVGFFDFFEAPRAIYTLALPDAFPIE